MHPASEIGASESSSQTRRTSSGCQTRSGARSTGATRSVGGSGSSPSSAQARLDEILSPLRGGEDDDLGHRMERSLRERRERAHLLDLVSEELDAHGLAAGAREDVHEAATNRDLASFVDPLHPLVAGERERLDEVVEADLLARRQANGRRSRV